MNTTIYIVDDELMAIKYLKSLIKTCGDNYKVIGEATNGVMAIPEISRLKPDIVFADISMPVMDGLHMAEEVLKAKNAPIIFMLTSYRDFDYVKKGMQMGVRDYILKNEVTETSLGELLERTCAELDQDRRECHLILEHNIRSFLLNNSEYTEDNIYKEKPLQRYALIHLVKQKKIQVKNARKQETIAVDCYDINRMEFPKGISCSAFAEMMAGEYCGILFIHEDCVDGDTKLYQAGRAMLQKFGTYCPDCIGLISDITMRFSQLQELYRSSRELLEYMYAFEVPQLLVQKELHIEHHGDNTLEKEFKDFQAELDNERLMETEVALDILLDRGKDGRNIWEYTDTVQNVYRCLMEYVQKQKLNPDHLDIQETYSSVSVLEEKLYACVDKILYELRERRELNYSTYVIDAVKFIQRNYHKDISLADIAEAAKISEGHLRRCFKQEMKVRVINYLMDCRLDHAKKLMKENDYTLDEIWKQTGFTSAQYFSYAFKQKEGVSPREYAKNIHKG